MRHATQFLINYWDQKIRASWSPPVQAFSSTGTSDDLNASIASCTY
jgi:hypothetical protein